MSSIISLKSSRHFSVLWSNGTSIDSCENCCQVCCRVVNRVATLWCQASRYLSRLGLVFRSIVLGDHSWVFGLHQCLLWGNVFRISLVYINQFETVVQCVFKTLIHGQRLISWRWGAYLYLCWQVLFLMLCVQFGLGLGLVDWQLFVVIVSACSIPVHVGHLPKFVSCVVCSNTLFK